MRRNRISILDVPLCVCLDSIDLCALKLQTRTNHCIRAKCVYLSDGSNSNWKIPDGSLSWRKYIGTDTMTKFERKQNKRQEGQERQREIAIHRKSDENMKRDGQYVMRFEGISTDTIQCCTTNNELSLPLSRLWLCVLICRSDY